MRQKKKRNYDGYALVFKLQAAERGALFFTGIALKTSNQMESYKQHELKAKLVEWKQNITRSGSVDPSGVGRA